jgi:outer membrane protein assembly factor BamB
MSTGLPPAAAALFAAPSVDDGDILVGHQRNVAALAPTGTPIWTTEPVPEGADSQSASSIAIAGGIAVGTFNRALGGVIAWDRTTGRELWRLQDNETIAINGSPVMSGDTVYLVTGVDRVLALDASNGEVRWRTQLDPSGFDWGNASIGTPALADGVLVVPTLYRDLVALDATTGTELWRHAGKPGPLRATHYRGAREAGFASSPVITAGIVWAADTSGELTALDLRTGAPLWKTDLGVPVLAGLAVSGDWLVAASYDGTVRALVPTASERPAPISPKCSDPVAGGGCCDAGGSPSGLMLVIVVVALRRRRA